MMMKKPIYLAAFTVLGALLSFLVHAAVEIFYIRLLLENFAVYGFGLAWSQWVAIHHVGSVVLLIGGIIFGYEQGRFWWPRLYNPDGSPRRRSSL
ncbi:MAG: hypothetical protein HYT40_01105 [Candidatus Sungbacteria bacterium]|uniref:Uncharacterized protein n=1 Tax=Candidatus Sungiibacteriota bacterium TaxID=2750080 RepID=A0A931SCV3_9BACT|nr:hypothetical protein [Candidatus Sungbacteria bacterium]